MRVLVAVAWPYASGPRHLGHVAGFGVPSDVFARYHRLAGNDVLMVSGTDEHGTPITVAAHKAGIDPRELVDRYNAMIVRDLHDLGLSYDLFTRTTTPNHYATVRDVFRLLHDKGYILRKDALCAVDPATGRTLPDRFIEGTCPICGYAGARGDQCDNCGNQLDPTDLGDPRSIIDGATPEFRDSEHFFFDLPAFAEELRGWISRQDHWRPNVRAFSLNLLDDLRPRAITRDLDWGVEIPLPEYEGRHDKRIYVWFDAVIGYLSASIEWANDRGTPDAWRQWWQNPESEHFYFMGKDNVVFHSVIWPSILLGASDYRSHPMPDGASSHLGLPYDIVASEFLTMEGHKFSTSRGISILVRDFLDRYDADTLRYFLTAAGPETRDTDFTWAEFVRRNNDELISTWGNLVNRSLSTAHKNWGSIPEPGPLTSVDEELLETVAAAFPAAGALIEAAKFKAALSATMAAAAAVNKYFSEQQPWHLVKSDPDRAKTVVYVTLRCVNDLKTLFAPYLPFSSERLHAMLGFDGQLTGFPVERMQPEDGGGEHLTLAGEYAECVGRWTPSNLPPGRPLEKPTALFRKLDPSIVDDELDRMAASAEESSRD